MHTKDFVGPSGETETDLVTSRCPLTHVPRTAD